MRRAALKLAFALALMAPPIAVASIRKIDPRQGCRSNPEVVGPCFQIMGRVVASNGTPSIRILRQETKRILGVLPAENEIAPACLRKHVSFDEEVVGRFTVCPFTKERPGEMQLVCVQDVKDAVAQPVVARGEARPSRKLPDCSLPDKGP